MADTLKRKVLLVHAKAMSGTSKKTGNRYEMCSIDFLNTDNVSPIKDAENNDYGYQVVSESLPYDCKNNIDIVPAFYNVEYEVVIQFENNKASTSLRPIGIAFDSPLFVEKNVK